MSLCLQDSDIYIAHLFRDFIAPTSQLKIFHNSKGAKNRKPQVLLRINSLKLIQDMESHGLCSRKTYKVLEFPLIREDLLSHFIRGVFDGDGCVVKSLAHNGVFYNKVSFCINWEPFLCKLKDILYNLGIPKIHIKKFNGKTVDWYVLYIHSSTSSAIFADFIYKDANFFLQRKKDKFLFQNTEVIAKSKEFATP
jgi:hypothetical protein